ncbi:MAG: Uma2 family endonuclease [Anaerolineae bacterium]
MSLAEYLALPSHRRIEIMDGEIKELSVQQVKHILVTRRIFRLLDTFTRNGERWETFSQDTFTTQSPDDPNWVTGLFMPDVMVLDRAALKEWLASLGGKNAPIPIIPSFVVEVLSPSDLFTEVNRKVRRYLSLGVCVVWVIDPEDGVVYVYTPDAAMQVFQSDAELRVEELLASRCQSKRFLLSSNLIGQQDEVGAMDNFLAVAVAEVYANLTRLHAN